jgi:hypothetical protein
MISPRGEEIEKPRTLIPQPSTHTKKIFNHHHECKTRYKKSRDAKEDSVSLDVPDPQQRRWEAKWMEDIADVYCFHLLPFAAFCCPLLRFAALCCPSLSSALQQSIFAVPLRNISRNEPLLRYTNVKRKYYD